MNILTFDLEEWFHILDNENTNNVKNWSNYEYRLKSNTDRILELLDAKACTATFFSLGWIARQYPDILRNIQSMGHNFASHSNVHKLVCNHDKVFFRNDLERSIKSIEDVIGEKITAYRAPGFSITDKSLWAFEEMINQGIKIDCSVFSLNHAHGGGLKNFGDTPSIINVNGEKLKEFPINTTTFLSRKIIFSGGGYFRFCPYFLTKRNMRKSNYVMSYFHPRDFDYNQPVIEGLNPLRRFKSYYGLNNSFNKFDRFISEFDFVDLYHADKLIDWDSVNEYII